MVYKLVGEPKTEIRDTEHTEEINIVWCDVFIMLLHAFVLGFTIIFVVIPYYDIMKESIISYNARTSVLQRIVDQHPDLVLIPGF